MGLHSLPLLLLRTKPGGDLLEARVRLDSDQQPQRLFVFLRVRRTRRNKESEDSFFLLTCFFFLVERKIPSYVFSHCLPVPLTRELGNQSMPFVDQGPHGLQKCGIPRRNGLGATYPSPRPDNCFTTVSSFGTEESTLSVFPDCPNLWSSHIMEEEEQQKESEGKNIVFRDPIHSPHRHLPSSLQTHHRSLPDSCTQFKSRSIPPIKHTHFTNNNDVVFPPINHEGLHHLADNNKNQQVRDSPCSSGEENGLLWVPQGEPGIGSSGGGEVLRWAGAGFELLRSRVTCIASSVRNFAGFGGVNWSFGRAAQVAGVVLVWWLFVVVRRRRQDSRGRRRESRDQLMRVIKEKDEKIGQLLHQIAQMNQLLLALHGGPLAPLPGTGGLTK